MAHLVVCGSVELAGDTAALLRTRGRQALERLAHVVRVRGGVELHLAVRLLVLLALVQLDALGRPLDKVHVVRRVAVERRRRLERLRVRLARRQLAAALLQTDTREQCYSPRQRTHNKILIATYFIANFLTSQPVKEL